jgi:hypothetical protein
MAVLAGIEKRSVLGEVTLIQQVLRQLLLTNKQL